MNAVDLIRLGDGRNKVIVRVTGRMTPGALTGHDAFNVVFVVVSDGFIGGSREDAVLPSDLQGWVVCLDALQSGNAIVWRDSGRGVVLRVEPWLTGDGLDVSVDDETVSGVRVRLPVRVPPAYLPNYIEII